MAYTPVHSDWKDYPDTTTPITAAALEHIEAGIVAATTSFVNVKDQTYGAVGDGTTDDTAALQAALTAAFNSPGGTMFLPVGDYKITSALVTPTDTQGSVRILGAGRMHSGVPGQLYGSCIHTTSTTDSLFKATVTTVRQSITFESITLKGNSAGTTGHGIHYSAAAAPCAIIPTLRDVDIFGCKQHGVFLDGCVFEGQLFNVRAEGCGSAGFKAQANNGGIPGEMRAFACTFDDNDIGVDLSGGGGFTFFGLTVTSNDHEAVKANGVGICVHDLQMEINSQADAAGNWATITNCGTPVFSGVHIAPTSGQTGIGMAFPGSICASIIGFETNASAAGVGWVDISFANASRCEVIGYYAADSVDRLDLGTVGGHIIRRAGQWLTGQTHGQQVISQATTADIHFDATKYDSFLSTRTGANSAQIRQPDMYLAYHNGQRLTFEIYNNSGGVITTTWESVFHLAGAWVDPANGKTRTITFEWNNTRSAFFEMSRSAADIT